MARICEMAGNRGVMAWSPDERQALIAEAVGPLQVELYVADLASGAIRCITAGQPPARYAFAHWTERGLFLLSDRPHERGALCRLDVESAALSPLVTADAHPDQGELELLAVSGDGKQAAYTSNHEGYGQLWGMDLETSA
ncbi:MAG: hypothetical protein D6790_19860, partial [Caldilineae bacterium]